jgi:hypothetical protein
MERKSDEIAIQSLGAPPERHADRVIAEMLRILAMRRAQIATAITQVRLNSKDGTETAQQRMAERIRRAGAIDVTLKPGKRGKYEMTIFELVGWDPARDTEIGINDALPHKPWIAALFTRVSNRGRDVKAIPFLFVTHHYLSRTSQRFGLRTADEVITASVDIWDAMMALHDAGMSPEQVFEPPPIGHRVPVGTSGMIVVLAKHEKRTALVAKTVLFEHEVGSEDD